MTNLEAIRSKALDEMERAKRGFLAALFGATLFEGFFLVALLIVADFKNNLHLLIMAGVGLIYMPIVLGLIALGAYVNRCTLRILTRVDDVLRFGGSSGDPIPPRASTQ